MNANVYRTKGVLFQDPPIPWKTRAWAWARPLVAFAWAMLKFLFVLPIIMGVMTVRMVIALFKVIACLVVLPIVLLVATATGRRIELIICR